MVKNKNKNLKTAKEPSLKSMVKSQEGSPMQPLEDTVQEDAILEVSERTPTSPKKKVSQTFSKQITQKNNESTPDKPSFMMIKRTG